MKKKITYFLRCEFCGKIEEYIARDKNVNSDLTNKDIKKMMLLYLENPTIIQYCDNCKMETLQTRIAWKGTLDT